MLRVFYSVTIRTKYVSVRRFVTLAIHPQCVGGDRRKGRGNSTLLTHCLLHNALAVVIRPISSKFSNVLSTLPELLQIN